MLLILLVKMSGAWTEMLLFIHCTPFLVIHVFIYLISLYYFISVLTQIKMM